MITRVSCPGKINLFLDVCRQRKNGYHDILTLFLPVTGIEDIITIKESSSFSIETSNPNVPCDERNLCWKAVDSFAEIFGVRPNWKINIEKNLPVAGGMGGGSSNAAAVLNVLAEKYNLNDTNKLQKAALKIGADVPYFLNPLPAVAGGVGEEITILRKKEKIPLLLITFDFPVSAAWAYNNRARPFQSSGITQEQLIEKWSTDKWQELVYNDLGFAVKEKFPLVEMTCRDLIENGALAADVSGSGPSVFGLFDSEKSRSVCMKKLCQLGIPESNLFQCSAG